MYVFFLSLQGQFRSIRLTYISNGERSATTWQVSLLVCEHPKLVKLTMVFCLAKDNIIL